MPQRPDPRPLPPPLPHPTAPATDKVVTGSFSGVLRIFAPTSSEGLAANALLLEAQLGAPVLGLGAGRFDEESPRALALAVLHPRSLCVYAVEEVHGDGGSGEWVWMLRALRSRAMRGAL